MGDVAKQLNNPVADLWALNFQFNLTVPVDRGIGKLVRIGPLPVRFTAEANDMAIQPYAFGQHWGVRF